MKVNQEGSVIGIDWRQIELRRLLTPLLAIVLVIGVVGCGDRAVSVTRRTPGSPGSLAGRIAEVAPPAAIQALRQSLDAYQPQVAILSPRPNEVLQDNQVSVRFRVQDLDLFKNEDLGLGPHLHVFLDNQPYIAVYDPSQPLELTDLAPGTHSLRVFASRPWHESFKNEGAFAETKFHVFTKTPDNNFDPALPLLTYSRPQGSYGAEPVMLDFYLTNAPLHLIAQEDPDDEITDWRIRCTINGESFVIDRWEPIYLKGLKPGKNWVQLEYLDENGDPVLNSFNNTVRVITYEPNGSDTLSKLVRGDLTAAEARGIVDRSYQPAPPEPEPTPEPIVVPPIEPAPVEPPAIEQPAEVEPLETPQLEAPQPEPTPLPELIGPEPEAPIEAEPAEQSAEEPVEAIAPTTADEAPIAPAIDPRLAEPSPTPAKRFQPQNFLNRFRRPAAPAKPLTPTETLPEAINEPTIDSVKEDLKALEADLKELEVQLKPSAPEDVPPPQIDPHRTELILPESESTPDLSEPFPLSP